MHPSPTRGLLIRLLEARLNQMSEYFQLARKRVHLSGCIRVPHGWVYSLVGLSGASILNPTLAIEMAQHNAAIEQREADPQAVRRDQRQDRPQEHTFEGIVEWAEQQAPQAMPIAEDNFLLSIEAPSCTNDDCDLLSLIAVAIAQ